MIIFIMLYISDSYAIQEQIDIFNPGSSGEDTNNVNETRVPSYSEYINYFNKENIFYSKIEKDATHIKNISAKGAVNNRFVQDRKAISFISDDAWAEWEILIDKEGYYQIAVEYCPLRGKQTDIQFGVSINGSKPFESADVILLNRWYEEKSEITKDYFGNDIRPGKTEVFQWSKKYFQDITGISNKPYYFYFKKGINTLKFQFAAANVAITKIIVANLLEEPDYSEYALSTKNSNNYGSEYQNIIYVQGETPYRSTHTVLYPTYDRQGVLTLSNDGSMNDPAKLRLNTIGQSSWKVAGQSILWKFDIERSGYYEIGMRARQNLSRGVFSTRRVYIDNQILFKELNEIEIVYDPHWQIKMLGDDAPYLIYLEKGSHEIALEAVSGRMGKYVSQLQSLILEMNDLYRKMIMITGTSPDIYCDYRLNQEIPDMNNRITSYIKKLRDIRNALEREEVKNGSGTVILEQIAIQLESFISKPRSVPGRLSNFQDNISSLSAWALSLTQQPLEIDYLFIQTQGNEPPLANSGILETLVFRFKSYLSSFYQDYDNIVASEDNESKDSLNVWIGLGRDQAQIVKDLITNRFTMKYNVTVNLSLIQQGLIEAIAAGKGPDILLYGGDVINLAARNALVELSAFEGFDEMKAWYVPNAFSPYTYNNGIYAIPLQQNYSMLFYRSDIFKELSLKPPETWNEFYEVSATLQKNKLSVGVPVGSVTAIDNSMFDTLLYQNGGKYYEDDFSVTTFNSETALKAFKQWTEFYDKYSFPQSFSFLVRFRSGEMPMAIQNYITYNTLVLAAPEIRGLWEMTTIPGTVDNEGNINRTVVAGSSPCIMLKRTPDKENAFKFMKWFSSAETQTEYGLTVENVLGEGARYDPANIEALKGMNWKTNELNILLKQLENVEFTPGIPASYYVTRNLSNAFRAVTIKRINPREALYSYNIVINAEITRKREELGLN